MSDIPPLFFTLQDAALSPDGKLIVASSSNGNAYLWDFSGNKLAELRGHLSQILDVKFDSNSQYIATSSWDATVRLWDTSGRELRVIYHDGPVMMSDFNPSGSKIVTSPLNDNSMIISIDSLDDLLNKGCGWLNSYFNYGSQSDIKTQQLCQEIVQN